MLEVGTSIERSHLRRHQHCLRSSSPHETTGSLEDMCFVLTHHAGACPQVSMELAADLTTKVPSRLHVGPSMLLSVGTVGLSDVFSGVIAIRDSGSNDAGFIGGSSGTIFLLEENIMIEDGA